jgi:hypothetical protein
MTEVGIEKNVIIFGAAMRCACPFFIVVLSVDAPQLTLFTLFASIPCPSCMEKCCRPDISFQLMERMKLENVAPNVHSECQKQKNG